MKPSQHYQQEIAETHKIIDPEQLAIMEVFDRIFDELKLQSTPLNKILNTLKPKKISKGVYLWGEVGRGKTYLLDCFYHCVPEPIKHRTHFHQFMREIHEELKTLQGKPNPLLIIAKNMSQKIKVLCLDECVVNDITDAMLLGELLKALFSHGLILVTTSNCAPDELYKNGLQRSRFIPAIEAIKAHTEVINLKTHQDYRLRHLENAGVYYTPLNSESRLKMETLFNKITHQEHLTQEPLTILGRAIPVIKKADNIAWFDFETLCKTHRSQNDYLALSQIFKIIFISDIPIIQAKERDVMTNFIKLIDVLYDAKIKVVITAAAEPSKLYENGPLAFEFKRTESRLIEMQSHEYFSGDSHEPS